MEPLCQASHKLYDKHLLFKWIRCSTFHWDDFKTIKEVKDTSTLSIMDMFEPRKKWAYLLKPYFQPQKVYDEHLLFIGI